MTPLLTIGDVDVFSVDQALAWLGPLAVDADGASDAYGPPGKKTRDALANAGRPGHWYGVATDSGEKDGNPVIQGPGEPSPGYYVSPTALQDPTHPRTSQLRYVNAAAIPFLSMPPELERAGVQLGDLGYCLHTQTMRCTAAIFADVGPHGKIGEGSPALAEALCVPSDARRGGCDRRAIACIAFVGSAGSPKWPRDQAEFSATAAALLTRWGGLQRLLELVK